MDNSKNNDKEVELTVELGPLKSTFEKQIIEAFKQQNSIDICNKLILAKTELMNYINDIKSKKDTYILNSNLLDKLDRISLRNYINVNLYISRIYSQILDCSNFTYISNESILLINFSNSCLRNLQVINSSVYSTDYSKKILSYLTFLLSNENVLFTEEQRQIIQELVKNLGGGNASEGYKKFKSNFNSEIIPYLKSTETSDKETGISKLFEYFFNMGSLSEQFNALLESGHILIKNLIDKPNPKNIDVYYRLADFVISFVFSLNYWMDLTTDLPQKEHISQNTHYLYDKIPLDIKEIISLKICDFSLEEARENMTFLNDKKFILNSNQKNILTSSTSIFSICTNIVKALCIYDKVFKLQYACYLILKRLYLIFPKYRNEIEDTLVNVLANLLTIKNEQKSDNIYEYEYFCSYIISSNSPIAEKLSNKLNNMKIELDIDNKNNINNISDKDKNKNINENENDINTIKAEYEVLKLSDFNMRIGCPASVTVEAGYEFERLIDVKYPESLIYIAVAGEEYDINFHLLKYCPSIKNEENCYEGQPKFYEIFKAERIDLSTEPLKIILFTHNHGIYKVIFDNKYSWFTPKVLRYRISVLNEQINENELNYDINNNIKQEGKKVKIQFA